MPLRRLVIIGGSDAGVSAALRARELNPGLDVTVLVADEFPNFSICGLPFFHSGEVADWHSLAHRTLPELEASGASFLLRHRATAIDAHRNTVAVDGPDGAKTLPCDRVVIATGAEPVRPPVAGLVSPRVFFLHSMADTFRLQNHLKTARPTSVVIVGTGYIGVEMADALRRQGLRVTLVGRSRTVLSTVDAPLGRIVEGELARHQVEVTNECTVETIDETRDGLRVTGTRGMNVTGDLVLIAAGVRPSIEVAATAEVRIGPTGAIVVDQQMQTDVPSVYAAGDCVETWHRLTRRFEYLPLGTTAHKQGVVAGENAAGGQRMFAGSLGTQVVKVFDLAVARTGLRDVEALEAGFSPLTVESRAWDHKKYYPDARELTIRVTADRQTRQLLGAQIVGHWKAGVAKRIDIFATALFHGMTVDAMNDLDLSYTPPLGSPWDAVQLAAQAWAKAVG
jgi:NADPH-dependent 2,4-dienoyl-CoA reductase/sulfur reductase-like enzyme